MIQIPDTKRGTHLVFVKCVYYCAYYVDGRVRRVSLHTEDYNEALKARDKFYDKLKREGATVKSKRSVEDKLKDKPHIYITRRKPYVVQVGRKKPVYCETIEEAIRERNKLL